MTGTQRKTGMDDSVPLYRVAVQAKQGGIIEILNIREEDYSQLHGFIARIFNKSSINELAFCEIHRIFPTGGGIQILYSSHHIWPSGKREERRGVLARKKPTDKLTEEIHEQVRKARTVLPTTIVPPSVGANVSKEEEKKDEKKDATVPRLERDHELGESILYVRPLRFMYA